MTPKSPTHLKDTQNEPDFRNIAIDRVGVKNLRYPIEVRDKARTLQHTIATVMLTVDGLGASVTTFIGFVLLGLAVGFDRIWGLRVVVIWCDCETYYCASTDCGRVIRSGVCSGKFWV